MNNQIIDLLSLKLNIPKNNILNTIKLIDDSCTIPFISRYRKEYTGGLDEVQISEIKENYLKLIELGKRKETILNSINEQDKLTDELKEQIDKCYNLSELEDIYLPFKPKRKTRASIAKANGLEPLAKIIMSQNNTDISLKAKSFINERVSNIDDAIKGAKDIIAEWINESSRSRNTIRNLFKQEAIIKSKVITGKEELGIKYFDYFKSQEELKRCASHRLLALRRGESEGILNISISVSDDKAIEELKKIFIKSNNESSEYVLEATEDSYKRLIAPSIENEFAALSKEKADKEAIRVFANNLKQLLIAAPLGQKRVLAIDPGYKNGCKIVCLDELGNLVHNEIIYPNKPKEDIKQSKKKIISLMNAYKIEAIAIGNGTASRETEFFIQSINFEKPIKVFIVSENGASIYSASPIAREEFPSFDVNVRGAVSIGRRLMDPLAELVKIDPKSIGVGQYQHDVNQTMLKNSLDEVVEHCVNLVGVNVNTASKYLLTYISGLGPQLAENIVKYRTENGKFYTRNDIKNVARMGDKAFEQSSGFLKIVDGKNPLDNTSVHPESYHIVNKMAKDIGCNIEELIKNKELRQKINPQNYIKDNVGLHTINDILTELEKPGLDPRKSAKFFEFAKGIKTIEDIRVGMIIPGIVTNVTNFGAFVDIGVKQDGLVHISNLKNEFIANPSEVVNIHQHVSVKVIELDIQRKRIQLSMKDV